MTGEFKFLTAPFTVGRGSNKPFVKTHVLFQDLDRLLLSYSHSSLDCWKRPDYSRTPRPGIMFARFFFLPISMICLLLGAGAFVSPSVPVLRSSPETTRRTSSLRMVSHLCDVRGNFSLNDACRSLELPCVPYDNYIDYGALAAVLSVKL